MQIYSSTFETLKWRIFNSNYAVGRRWQHFIVSADGACARNLIGMYQLTNLLFPLRLKWDISIKIKWNIIKPICMSPIFSVCTMAIKLWISGRCDALSMFVFSRSCHAKQAQWHWKSLYLCCLMWQWKRIFAMKTMREFLFDSTDFGHKTKATVPVVETETAANCYKIFLVERKNWIAKFSSWIFFLWFWRKWSFTKLFLLSLWPFPSGQEFD